jgi:hypothetical protein
MCLPCKSIASTIWADVGGLLTLAWPCAAGAVVGPACWVGLETAAVAAALVACGAAVGCAALVGLVALVGWAGAPPLDPELHAESSSAAAMSALEYI